MAGLFDKITTNVVDFSNKPYEYPNRLYGELNDQLWAENINSSNLGQNPAYLEGVQKINPLAANRGIGGVVFNKSQDTVNINPNSFLGTVNSLGHEAAHVQQNRYKQFLKDNDINASVYGTNAGNIYTGFFEKMQREDFRNRLTAAYSKYKDKYGLGDDFKEVGILSGKPHETMANLQAIEASLPSGQTLLDTDIGKDIFKTKDEKQMYLKVSLPGVMKALEYDPSLWEIAKDRADYAARVFKDKSTASSYAKAAADAFKAFMSGPEAKVEYQDPFGDTTK